MTTRARNRIAVSICAFVVANLASAAGARLDGRAQTITLLLRDDARVASAGFRLAVANAGRCKKQMPATGLIVHTLAQYQGKWRDAARNHFVELDQVAVVGVVVQSPAALAGIQDRDAIIAINGTELSLPAQPQTSPTGQRDQTEDRLIALPVGETITLTIKRDGLERQLSLMPLAACKTRFELVAGSGQFARSDGRIIQIGQGLIGSLADADLAAVIAHELAHTILEHRAQLAELERSNDPASRQKRKQLGREFEQQADRLSVHLLASAGYDPRSAPAFMRRFGRSFDRQSTAGGLHASADARAAAMEDEIVRMGSVPAS